MVLLKRYLVLCLKHFLCYIVEQVSRSVKKCFTCSRVSTLQIQAVKDLGIRSACYFFETSYKLHMLRSLRA